MVSNPQERPNINWVIDQVQDLQSRSPNTQTNMVWSCTVHWIWETFAHINSYFELENVYLLILA